MVPSRDPVGNRNRRSPGHLHPCSTTKHGDRQIHAAATDSSPPPGVISGWPFRAQLPVRTAAAPGGAFSAQTPPTRPFSYPAPHPSPPSANVPRRDRTTGIATVCVQSLPYLTPTSVGCLPPACWPPGSPRGTWCREGSDARLSRANVRHPAAAQARTAEPFVLDSLPGTMARRPPWVADEGRAFGACCFAGKLRSPAHASGDAATRPNYRAATPTSFPTSTPTSFPTRWGCVPLASLAERISAGQSPFVGPVSRKNRG